MCNVSFQNRVSLRASVVDIFGSFSYHLREKAVSKPNKERLRDVTQVAENPSQVQMVEH